MISKARYSFICAEDMAGKMDRVITFADGRVVSKEMTLAGTVFVVERT
jgi:hypothetical protein